MDVPYCSKENSLRIIFLLTAYRSAGFGKIDVIVRGTVI